jgi:hypothetical protein
LSSRRRVGHAIDAELQCALDQVVQRAARQLLRRLEQVVCQGIAHGQQGGQRVDGGPEFLEGRLAVDEAPGRLRDHGAGFVGSRSVDVERSVIE